MYNIVAVRALWTLAKLFDISVITVSLVDICIYKCKKAAVYSNFIHELTASDTSKTAKITKR